MTKQVKITVDNLKAEDREKFEMTQAVVSEFLNETRKNYKFLAENGNVLDQLQATIGLQVLEEVEKNYEKTKEERILAIYSKYEGANQC